MSVIVSNSDIEFVDHFKMWSDHENIYLGGQILATTKDYKCTSGVKPDTSVVIETQSGKYHPFKDSLTNCFQCHSCTSCNSATGCKSCTSCNSATGCKSCASCVKCVHCNSTCNSCDSCVSCHSCCMHSCYAGGFSDS